MKNKNLDDLARSLGKDPEKTRRDVRVEIEAEYKRRDEEELDFEDSITPKATTFLIRVPRLSRKGSLDPVRRRAVLRDAIRSVKTLKMLLALAEQTFRNATEQDGPSDLLENGPEEEVVDLTGDKPVRISFRAS